MSEKTIYICDRCAHEQSNRKGWSVIKTNYKINSFDLCYDCTRKHKEFLRVS